jgi:hypothetical protein
LLCGIFKVSHTLLDVLPSYLAWLILPLIPVAIWSYFWTIIGLWFSARKAEKAWFVVFAFVHTAGLLEIYYLHSRKCWPFKSK